MIKEFTLPKFEGFYESDLRNIIINSIEYYVDNIEDTIVKDMVGEIVYDNYDYKGAKKAICQEYAKQYVLALNKALPFKVKLVKQELTSPSYYNFETDKLHITIYIPDELFAWLKDKASEGKFAELVKEEFTDYSGFHSFHSSKVQDWLDEEIKDWDNIKLGTLLEYALDLNEKDRAELADDIVYIIAEDVDLSEFHKEKEILVDLLSKLKEQGVDCNNLSSSSTVCIEDIYVGTDNKLHIQDKQTPDMFK